MIRYIEFPAEQTAEILERLIVAGKGAVLRVIPRATDDATAVKFLIDVRAEDQRDAAADDCDEPVNKSHLCPPTC